MSGRFWIAAASTLLLSAPVFLWSPAGAADQPKPPKKPAAGADVFGLDKVWQFHLTLTAAEYAAMQPALGMSPGGPSGPMPPPKNVVTPFESPA